MRNLVIAGCVTLGLSACAHDKEMPPPPSPPPVIHEYVPPVVDSHPNMHHHHGHVMHHKPPVTPDHPVEHKTKWQKMKEWKSKHLHHNDNDGSSK